MSSRFFPSLLHSLWESLPLPDWLALAGDETWHQTLHAIAQLWREAGRIGVAVSGPVPWLPRWEWQWQPEWPEDEGLMDPLRVLPSGLQVQRWLFTPDLSTATTSTPNQTIIPLLPRDPLREEQFLLLSTPLFSVIAARGIHPLTEQPGMMVSFDPAVVERAWSCLERRVQTIRHDALPFWTASQQNFPPQVPHFRVLSRYSTLLLLAAHPGSDMTAMAQLPPASETTLEGDPVPSPDRSPEYKVNAAVSSAPESVTPADQEDPQAVEADGGVSEAELLRALVHEVRTPLSTIRTLVQLLLRQKDLPPKIKRQLERIDQECTEQINRFNLFFQATEPDPKFLQLEAMALVDLVRQSLPMWQRQVQRRGSTLEMDIPNDLPNIVSDPKTLGSVLSGMVDRIARISPPGSRIVAHLVSAGEQVKLQFRVNTEDAASECTQMKLTPLQAIGQLLVLQPDTGAISLSIPVTQTLFRALGGYLTVRHKAQQGEVFTIYLPRQI